MKSFTIISDPGIDDLIALVLLYKLMPDVVNCLISTFGNASEEITARNAKEFISSVANSWYFMSGSKLPLNGKVEHPWPEYFHGPDGVWGVHPQTKHMTIKTLSGYPENTNTLSLAPMREALKLLQKDRIKQCTIMGGAFNIEGNETKYAETNIAFDPDSASEFFSICRGVIVKVVPLDVTRKVSWNIEAVRAIPEGNEINKWLKELLLAWFDKYNHEREKNFNLHDPLAVYLSFYPEKAQWIESGIEVIQEGEQRGRTILNNKNPNCAIAIDLKTSAEISDHIYRILFS